MISVEKPREKLPLGTAHIQCAVPIEFTTNRFVILRHDLYDWWRWMLSEREHAWIRSLIENFSETIHEGQLRQAVAVFAERKGLGAQYFSQGGTEAEGLRFNGGLCVYVMPWMFVRACQVTSAYLIWTQVKHRMLRSMVFWRSDCGPTRRSRVSNFYVGFGWLGVCQFCARLVEPLTHAGSPFSTDGRTKYSLLHAHQVRHCTTWLEPTV